jgi:gliding motility-associated-like protein
VVVGSLGQAPFSYDIGAGVQSSGVFGDLFSGTYTIVVSDSLGCADSISVDVGDTSTLEYVLINVVDEDCGSGNGWIEVIATGGLSPYNYSLGSTTQASGIFENLSAGDYTLTVSDSIGCSLTTIVSINLIPLDIDLGPDISSCDPVTLSSPLGTGYNWNTSETSQSITVSTSGQYFVDYDYNGCQASDTITVMIYHPVGISAPNVFTPDGNGENDEFKVTTVNITDFHIVIYNRWGVKLFESNNVLDSWDGTGSHGLMKEGVYFWTIEYADPCIGDETQTKKGIIHLFD